MFGTCIYFAAGFSLQDWLSDRNLTSGGLTEIGKRSLFEELGIVQYMDSSQCYLSESPYTPTTRGWNSGKYGEHIFKISWFGAVVCWRWPLHHSAHTYKHLLLQHAFIFLTHFILFLTPALKLYVVGHDLLSTLST